MSPVDFELSNGISPPSQVHQSVLEMAYKEQLFRDLVEHSQAAIYQLDAQGIIVYASPSCCELVGMGGHSIVDLDFRPYVHPDDLDYCMEMFRQAVATKTAQTPYEYRVLRVDGAIRRVRTVLVPMLDQRGEITGFVGNTIDITTEFEARAEAEKLSTLAKLTQSGVLHTDVDLKITWVNDAFLRLTGFSLDEVIGQPPSFQCGELTDPLAMQRHADCIARREAFSDDIFVYRKNGQPYFVHLDVMPVYDAGGSFAGYVGMQTDMTDRLATERQLNELNHQLRQALEQAAAVNRAKSEFIANMSHEIRTPMTAILGITQILTNSISNAADRDYLKVLDDNAHNLLQLLDDLLDISKIEAGKLDIVEEDFNLHTKLGQFAKSCQLRAQSKGLHFAFDLDPAVPVWVHGSSLRLSQILQNLFNNALKFTERGTIQLQVRPVESKQGRSSVRFAIKDTGPGVPDALKERLFERFEQLDNSVQRKFGGTGIGLAICKKLCVLLSGDIGFHSPATDLPEIEGAGPGTEVWFTLPFGQSASLVVAKPRAIHPVGKARFNGKVLCVEDTEANRLVIEWLLSQYGVITEFAGDGKEGLNKMKAAAFDLVLMDIQMPGMSGFEVCREWRENLEPALIQSGRRNRLPIVALTAHAMSDDRQRCLAAGMDGYLSKPIDADELPRVLAGFLTEADATPGQLIDVESIAALFAGNHVIVKSLLKSIHDELPLTIQDFRQQQQQSNLEKLSALLHKTKGALGYLQVDGLYELIQSTELAAQDATPDCGPLITKIIGKLEAIHGEISNYLASS